MALWMADERPVPGPVDAYLRLFKLLPPSLRQIELNRLKQKGTGMRDGIYRIIFRGETNGQAIIGDGVLIFENGGVYGWDTAGVLYDGDYEYNEISGMADVKLKVTFPPNVKAVFGISNPYEWSIDVTATVKPMQQSGVIASRLRSGGISMPISLSCGAFPRQPEPRRIASDPNK
jgi:hypothetical protein